MLKDSYKTIFSGKLVGPEPDSSILKVVDFVETHLIEFSKKYAGSNIQNEKGLTQKLVFILNRYSKNDDYPFWFYPEYMENSEIGTSPHVDIGAITTKESVVIETKTYSYEESFFSMEAKRLSGKLDKKREKEYLIGRNENGKYKNTGGVERFKQEIHGRNLKYGAIIGYVQEYDFHYWHKLINGWIDKLIDRTLLSRTNWSRDDILKQIYIKRIAAKFISLNSRENDLITLFHLWISLKR